MFSLNYVVCLVTLAIFSPYPTWQHFIWPLDWCVLADFCNHTWIPECGVANTSNGAHFRLFIDECDMFEYNCDNVNLSDYHLTNYSLCYGAACLADDDKKNLRIGDYKIFGKERKWVYDPTNAWGQKIITSPTTRFIFPTTTKPNLPKHMLSGRRRFTPYGPFWARRFEETTTRKKPKKRKRNNKRTTKKMTTMKISPTLWSVIKKVTFKKKNRTFVRVFKQVVKQETSSKRADNDFLE